VTETFEFAVIGGGIAGASAAFRLAEHGRTVLLEAESQPGYHTTGRSAALYSERYRNPVIRGLAAASGALLSDPPDGFADAPLLLPRGLLIIGRPDQGEALKAQFTPEQVAAGIAEPMPIAEACRLCPALRHDYAAGAFFVPGAQDIDVNGLHRGFLRGFARAGGRLFCDARVSSIVRDGEGWRIESADGAAFRASVIVNAAGAWTDEVGRLAGLGPLGLAPKRRTCITFDPPQSLAAALPSWPMVMDAAEEFYFKPEAGRVLASPADETDTAPVDAQPEELDVALAADRIERATVLEVRRITHRWAGLRSFLPDKMPVAGPDPAEPGFIWLAGLGGFGIMTSEALGRAAASAALRTDLPRDLAARGIKPGDLSPERLKSIRH
jgi:D-arginine dehydrogenase